MDERLNGFIKGDYLICCETKDELNQFLQICDKANLKWRSGKKATELDYPAPIWVGFCNETPPKYGMYFHFIQPKMISIAKFKNIFKDGRTMLNQSIHITTNGRKTFAVIKNGNEVIAKGVAKCHPDDEFDFKSGATIAFNRAFEEIENRQVYNGKVVCVGKAGYMGDSFTVGKIYEVKNGKMKDDNGRISPVFRELKSFEDLRDYSPYNWLEIVE